MKPVLSATQRKSGTLYRLAFPIEGGGSVACEVFPIKGQLRYRYIAEDAEGNRQEFFSQSTYPSVLESYNQLPEGDRGPAPLQFSDSQYSGYLNQLTNARQTFLGAAWIAIPDQDVQTIKALPPLPPKPKPIAKPGAYNPFTNGEDEEED